MSIGLILLIVLIIALLGGLVPVRDGVYYGYGWGGGGFIGVILIIVLVLYLAGRL